MGPVALWRVAKVVHKDCVFRRQNSLLWRLPQRAVIERMQNATPKSGALSTKPQTHQHRRKGAPHLLPLCGPFFRRSVGPWPWRALRTRCSRVCPHRPQLAHICSAQHAHDLPRSTAFIDASPVHAERSKMNNDNEKKVSLF